AFRVFPLLCGLVSVPAFAWLSRRVLTEGAALLATLLFAVADQVVYYSSEAKPYEADVAATVVLLAVGAIMAKSQLTRRSGVVLASLGVAAVVFSFAAVFVVAAGGTAFAA